MEPHRAPAICNSCGRAFLFPVDFEPGPVPELRCPVCNGIGKIADVPGAYWTGQDGKNYFTPQAAILSDGQPLTDATIAELKAFFEEASRNSQLERFAIVEALERVPALAPIAEMLPHDRKELYSFLSMLLSFLAAWRVSRERRQKTRNEAKRERRARRTKKKRPKKGPRQKQA